MATLRPHGNSGDLTLGSAYKPGLGHRPLPREREGAKSLEWGTVGKGEVCIVKDTD